MQDLTDMDLELINLIDHDTTKIFQHRIPLIFKDEDIDISEENTLLDFYHHRSDQNIKKIKFEQE